MYIRRKQQLVIIVALVVGIAGLSIGFAAFSATLNISSSASVTPNSSDFSVKFSGSESDPNVTEIYPDNEIMGTIAKTNGTAISDMNVVFNGSGYQSVQYTFYVHNTGAYTAYLKSVDFGQEKICRKVDDATDSLVQAACNDIFFYFYGESVDFYDPSGKYDLGGQKIEPGDTMWFSVGIDNYGENLVDGDFVVEFDDIVFEYSSVDWEETTITVLGKNYTAIKNMTWLDWLESEYNIDNFSYDGHEYVRLGPGKCIDQGIYEIIQENGVYELGDDCIDVGG